MDIRATLQQGQSKSNTLRIMKYIGTDKTRFKTLVDIFLNSDYRMTQRAAWPLGDHSLNHPELIKPHIPKMIKMLGEKDHHPAIPRNILRIFQEVDVPEKYRGPLLDMSLKFIMDISQPLAVRAFSITVAARICSGYEELKNELIIILDELKKYPQSPALTVRIREAYKTLRSR
ncbi:MAG: hypothetical protein K0S32_666 [Bacteroidetes bacterium]|jgi:hypothetical protein|nr:hypothetical protein [Bacteroidota bacterium]